MDALARPASLTRSRDEAFLRRCLHLALKGEGSTRPNPMVGAVVARAGRAVSEAFHERAGGPHAEAAALRRAGKAARGATLYVNLEPCSHYGRTPPCVQAIVAAGIRRVVASHPDPYPLVAGRGFRALRQAGVRVDVGLLRAPAQRLNERYLTFMKEGRPFVLVKAAMSLDGRIAAAGGRSRWISSAESRRQARRWRSIFDAVMVGAGTAVRDNPLLTARDARNRALPAGSQPVRVLLDSRLRVSPRAKIFSQRGGGRVFVYCTRAAAPSRMKRLARTGARVRAIGGSKSTRVPVRAVLRDLGRERITSVLIEGGGELIASALAAHVVDKVALFVAPIIIGGGRTTPVVAGAGAGRLEDAIRVTEMTVSRSGTDRLVVAYLAGRRR
ncbi:MAG TPA: bifunctional diaminohydroxyphosphoribosylaminopyrimidine deaminase/5-amino-6-(5-phosphoribosylamino)uracil reductase RibD [Candidatus Polarisedimenticolia bacterium]|nr:bifunctional diaminohydroxyphosphoribosylaminopyrimidine deaminase/5-amino-6-(5-phosphoribosylamino)uracil reductase RibD [Candidatus Polarisedimenticolia bacterium]